MYHIQIYHNMQVLNPFPRLEQLFTHCRQIDIPISYRSMQILILSPRKYDLVAKDI